MFTDQQWEAVHASGSNLLISASAGSGKTMVLVNRIIEKIKKGTAIDELLVVTFTNAAAKEMKERIQTAIQKEINADPDSNTRHHLVAQLPKLGHANISTLHSFCLKVIERYYYLIDFDPVFRQLTDETEIELIKEDIWDEILEEFYTESDPDFLRFMEAYSGDRSDTKITQMVFQLHEFSRANENPDEWLASLSKLYDMSSGELVKSEIYINNIKKQWIDEFTYMIQLADQALSLLDGVQILEKQYGIISSEKDRYIEGLNLIEANELEKLYDFMQDGYKHGTLTGASKKEEYEAERDLFNDKIKPLRNEAKEVYVKFESNFLMTHDEQVEAIQSTKAYVDILAKMTKEFADAYQAYKANQKLIDFNDLEHLTLRILKGDREGDVSEASHYYRRKFAEVLVDEYQDINALQEAILLRLAQPDEMTGNYFMVGDVKQSIYGFRLADPRLFLSKYEKYKKGSEGHRIILAENFRSRDNILSFTNFIFTQLMDEEVGNLIYDKNAELVYGNKDFTELEGYETEILIYEKNTEEELETIESSEDNKKNWVKDKASGEISMVASRIKDLVDSEFMIYDKETKKMREVKYSDIVLLTPTKSKNLRIQEIFQEVNIPTAINQTQNFFQTTEVTIMMSLLKIIDNPRQDIPLVATLRSPIVGLNEVDLTYIRLADRQGDFYEAMMAYVEQQFEDSRNKSLQKKLKVFVDQLDSWREYARRYSVVDLLRTLYQETGYIYYVGGMSNGKQRRANLEALYERAAAYEKTSFKGLYRFIRFIDKMQEKDKDLSEPTSMLSEENAVRVMTIHASKGLEFPLVFVMDMSKEFNNNDWVGEYVFDRDLGIGLQYKNPDSRIRTSTLVDTAIKNLKKRNAYAEEMRVLYVALTRAEQKLFLVGTVDDEEKAIQNWDKGNMNNERHIPSELRLSINNFMDWVGSSLARHQDLDGRVPSHQENQTIKKYSVPFKLSFYSATEIIEQLLTDDTIDNLKWVEELKQKTFNIETDKKTLEAVESTINLIDYNYPFKLSTVTTSYQSVSEVKQLFEEPNDGQLARIDLSDLEPRGRYTQDLLKRPSFLQQATLATPAEIGQATHLLLQKLILNEEPTAESLSNLLKQMIGDELLTEEVASEIELDKIIRYFKTPFGQKIIKNFNHLEREVLFSFMMNARDVFHEMDVDDPILIHGIIDGYFETEEGYVLFDYKTDKVSFLKDKAHDELIRRYKGQVMLYKEALESIMDKPVVSVNIISLDLTDTIQIL